VTTTRDPAPDARTRHAAAALESSGEPPAGMVRVPGGVFLMGSSDFYPEEGPVHRVSVDEFFMDAHLVTVGGFARFVEATGYVTVAERPPNPSDYIGVAPSLLVPGSLVFRAPARRVSLRDPRRWWAYVPGACWHRPDGPDSTTRGREMHPVTHVAYEDAAAYATWSGKELPTEAEWERAARGGLEGATFTWGDEHAPGGTRMANTWQGEFPWQNLASDDWVGTSPVGAYPANGYGLFDMAGNVWEWTSDFFTPRHASDAAKACCIPHNPRVESAEPSRHPELPGGHIPRRVLKGGSYLCAPNFCLRYRPAARQGEAVDTSTGHIGFRCIVRGRAERRPASA
jgi:sulfatase modifying factor 1